MKFRLDRAWVTFLVMVCVLGVPLGLAGAYVAHKHAWATERLAEIEPRYARLLGLQASAAVLERAANESAARLRQFVYPASQEATPAGNDAQQRARKALEGAGLTIVSSQVLAPVEEGGYDRIPISIRLEGQIEAVQKGLAALAAQSPVLLVDSFSLQKIGVAKADAPQRLSGQLVLSALRVRS